MVGLTGATGFLGRSLTPVLLAAGHKVRLLARQHVSDCPAGAEQQSIGSLGEVEILPDALEGCQVLVHAAARAHRMEDDPGVLDPYVSVNVRGSEALMRAAIAAGVQRVVFISSIKVCGEQTLPGQLFTVSDRGLPEGAYSITKQQAEQSLAAMAHEAGVELLILRLPLVHGIGAKGNLAMLCRAIARRRPLPLGSIRRNRRSLLGIKNCCHAINRVVKGSWPVSGDPVRIYHLCDDGTISTRRLVELLAEGMGERPRLWPMPRWLAMAAALPLGRTAAVRRLFGDLEVDGTAFCHDWDWRPGVSLEGGLMAMGQAWRACGGWST